MEIDVLADVLSIGQLGSKIICRPVLPGRWGLQFDIEKRSMFHIITRGSCWIVPYPGSDAVKLVQGDIAFLSECRGHSLMSAPEAKVAHYQKELSKIKNWITKKEISTDNATHLFCGSYQLEGDISLPVFSLLPPFIHINADSICNEPNLQRLISVIMGEEAARDTGSDVILSRLVDALLIYIIRIWAKTLQDEPKRGWLYGLNDPKIGKVISLMHQSPSKKWTVGLLAKSVSMSRASFARKFSEFTGEAPLYYLTSWRMDLSAKLLRDSKMSIHEIASCVGYESEPSFSKVFKKYRNVPPGKYRIRNRNQDSKKE